jgi:hypothetical protein
VTLIAVGGFGAGSIGQVDFWGQNLGGTVVGFPYGGVAPWESGRPPRREAERDAAEVRAVAAEFGASRAIGSSRGAQALVGALADGYAGFERIALAIPPGGSSAGRYREWLADAKASVPATSADILVLAYRGDTGHPLARAEEWSGRLGARLAVFPSLHCDPQVFEAMRTAIHEFLDESHG